MQACRLAGHEGHEGCSANVTAHTAVAAGMWVGGAPHLTDAQCPFPALSCTQPGRRAQQPKKHLSNPQQSGRAECAPTHAAPTIRFCLRLSRLRPLSSPACSLLALHNNNNKSNNTHKHNNTGTKQNKKQQTVATFGPALVRLMWQSENERRVMSARTPPGALACRPPDVRTFWEGLPPDLPLRGGGTFLHNHLQHAPSRTHC